MENKNFLDFLVENLKSTTDVKLSKEFKNPVTTALSRIYTTNDSTDIKDNTNFIKKVSLLHNLLKPTQKNISLIKTLGLAINGIPDNSQTLVSNDNCILDGHHIWAANVLNNLQPKTNCCKIKTKCNDIQPLIDALSNVLPCEISKEDLCIFDATIEDIENLFKEGNFIKGCDKQKIDSWLESIGGIKKLTENINYIKSLNPIGVATVEIPLSTETTVAETNESVKIQNLSVSQYNLLELLENSLKNRLVEFETVNGMVKLRVKHLSGDSINPTVHGIDMNGILSGHKWVSEISPIKILN